MKRELLSSVCILLLCINVAGQIPDDETSVPMLKKNAVYATAGLGLAYGTLMANYERLVIQRPSISLGARAAVGLWGNVLDKGADYLASVYGLTGSNKNHFEFGFGMNVRDPGHGTNVLNGEDPTRVYPAFNLGYRFSKPGGTLIFRTGAGWPEALYLSLGVAF